MSTNTQKTLDALRQLAPGTEFTSAILAEQMQLDHGPVTGFMTRAVRSGAVKIVGAEGRSFVYTVVDPDLYGTVRESGSFSGGKTGRSVSGTTDSKRMAGLLRTIADQIEAKPKPSSLHDFTTSELIRELARRDRSASRAQDEESQT